MERAHIQHHALNVRGSPGRAGRPLDSAGGKNWQEGKGFKVFVYLVRAKQGAYPIVSATIPGSQ